MRIRCENYHFDLCTLAVGVRGGGGGGGGGR